MRTRDRWLADPVTFVQEVLINPETGKPFQLYPEQKKFLRIALQRKANGRLAYPEMVAGQPKKSGKTALAAMILIYVVRVLGGRFAEGYVLANDFEQSRGRVFEAACRIVEASPLLAADARITQNKIEFQDSGATITALASDYAGNAGANPTITIFDELWAYTSESAHRLFDEMVPVPTRTISCRLTVTYAGFEGESDLLETLYKRGLKGEEIAPDLRVQAGMVMFWTHRCLAPWQSEEWQEQMRDQLRTNAFLRLIENRWVSNESEFVPIEWWDSCIDANLHPIAIDQQLSVDVGVDASYTGDYTAIVVVTWDREQKKCRLVWHRVFKPTKSEPLNFEIAIEATLLDLMARFHVRSVSYDPYQMVSVAQRLTQSGLPMVQFPQTTPNLTEMGNNLFELIKGRAIAAYPDADMRLAVQRCIAIETPRGWRIAKEKSSHKIDLVVALAMAALSATRDGQAGIIPRSALFLTGNAGGPLQTNQPYAGFSGFDEVERQAHQAFASWNFGNNKLDW